MKLKYILLLCLSLVFSSLAFGYQNGVERDLKITFQTIKTLDELVLEFERQDALFEKIQKGPIHPEEAQGLKRIWSSIFDARVALNTLYHTYEGKTDDEALIRLASLIHLVNSGVRLSQKVWNKKKVHSFLNESSQHYPIGTLVSLENQIFKIFNSIPSAAEAPSFFPSLDLKRTENRYLRISKSSRRRNDIRIDVEEKTSNARSTFHSKYKKVLESSSNQWTVWKRFQVYRFKNLFYRVVKKVSTWLGDTKVKRRDDTYYNGKTLINLDKARDFQALLQSGDIMVSRTNWFLSNNFLPGFWMHSFIYLGGPEKLQEFNLDAQTKTIYAKKCEEQNLSCADFTGYLATSPSTKAAWRNYIQKDSYGFEQVLIEATSEGVHFSSIRHTFLNDYLGAMRPKREAFERAMAIEQSFALFGREYDFDFDYDSHDKLVCSEVVAKSYMPFNGSRGVNYDYDRASGRYVESYLGRYSLAVVDMVRKAADENIDPAMEDELEFVGFLKGIREENTARLVSEEEFYESAEWPKWDFLQD